MWICLIIRFESDVSRYFSLLQYVQYMKYDSKGLGVSNYIDYREQILKYKKVNYLLLFIVKGLGILMCRLINESNLSS